ncbi:MAG: NAD-dependent epimerase/dehydratase family protein [Chitinophagales bacterium]|nr:NAD(P)-dependent oxidoreductase [Sphingobacteriales bacterium]
MNKLFITGGTGFFGKNILKSILEDEIWINFFSEIVVLTRNSNKFLKEFPEFKSDKIFFIEEDVRFFKSNRTDFEYILHLATDASKDLNDHHPLEMIDVILNGTKNILEFADKQKELKKLIFASSGAVYGQIPLENHGVREEERFDLDFNNPINAYAQAKRTAEMMCSIYYERKKMPLIIARGFAFIGAYLSESAHFAIKNFERQAKETGKIIIQSDGNAKRSYMKGDELAKILLSLLTVKSNFYYIYNIGSDEAKTLKEWAHWIADKSGEVVVEILNNNTEGYSAGHNYIPNVDRMKQEVEF